MEYRPRIADGLLARRLQGSGGVLIQGPKWCGKTTTAEQQAASVVYMADSQNLAMAQISLAPLLRGATPRLVDEWQTAPALWDAARFEIDHRQGTGQFIFTGSAVPPDPKQLIHTGTGRFSRLTMRTMSLSESGDSSGQISLSALFEGAEPGAESGTDLEQIAYLVCRGGWPAVAGRTDAPALESALDYVEAVAEADIIRIDGVGRNPLRARRIMRSLARNQGAQVSLSTIRDDIAANEPENISTDTVADYLNALAGIFVTDDVRAWNPNLRSRTAIRTADTRYFTDPSIAAASLGLSPSDLMGDLNTLGLLFETLAVRDLRVYASAMRGDVFHYRDKTGLECDAVVHLPDGRYCLVEVKLGGEKLVDEGAASLLKLAERIDTAKMPAPSFLMVLTAVGRYAYRRKDGVCVVPITTLKH